MTVIAPPCSIGCPTVHVPSGQQRYSRRQTTPTDDRCQRAKQNWSIRRASNNAPELEPGSTQPNSTQSVRRTQTCVNTSMSVSKYQQIIYKLLCKHFMSKSSTNSGQVGHKIIFNILLLCNQNITYPDVLWHCQRQLGLLDLVIYGNYGYLITMTVTNKI